MSHVTQPNSLRAALPASPSSTQRDAAQPGWQGIFQPGSGAGPRIEMTRTKVRGLQRVFLLLDDSASMTGPKAAATNVAGNDLLGYLAAPGFRDGFQVSLITFDDTATVQADHARPSELLGRAAVTGKGGTDVHAALVAANRSRRAWQRDPSVHEVAPPVYLLMSDGCTTNTVAAQQEADAAKADGVTIVAVGFGSDADRAFLSGVASSPAHFKLAATPDDLKEFFAQVGATLRDSQRAGLHPGQALGQSLRGL